jgi:glycosyltransferase involved in cell wall biosynthesis
LRLVVYSHYFAPSVGGVETIVRSLASGLAGLRTAEGKPQFEVTVVTQTPADGFDDRSLGFPVVRRPGLLRLHALIRGCDVLHVVGPALAPLILAKVAGKPVVIEHHGFQTICPNGQLLIERGGMPCPGHFMAGRHGECLKCNSGRGWAASAKLWALTFVRRYLSSRVQANVIPTEWLGNVLRLPKAVHIAHGLEPRPPLAGPEAGPGKTPIVVFQGRLVTTKGVEILLQAARMLLDENVPLELLLIGEGSERERLEWMAAHAPLQGKVRFTGRLERGELERELAKADVVVVPSLGGEVFGLVVAENMQRGLPVIASDLGAFTEVLGNSGVVFRTGDARDLAQCLRGMLANRERRIWLGASAHRRVEELFSLARMIMDHAALYRRLTQ